MRHALSIGRALLFVFGGILLSGFASNAVEPWQRAVWLGASAVAFARAVPRRIGVGLVLAAVFALSGARDPVTGTITAVQDFTVFHAAFLALGTVGAFVLVSPRGFKVDGAAPGWACVLASLPAWALGHLHPGFPVFASALVFVGLVLAILRPLLSGRREPRPPRADPIAAPLSAVAPREYIYDRGARLLGVLAGVSASVAALGMVVTLVTTVRSPHASDPADVPVVGFAMFFVGAVLCLTFLGCLWLNRRLGFRVNEVGLYARRVFGEVSIPWTAVVSLERSQLMIKYGLVYEYWDVYATDRVIRFPDVLPGSAELRATIEAATGLRWAI
ncbi:MAG: hypothetical protein R3F49_16955 [Planctomycetota bacterium]